MKNLKRLILVVATVLLSATAANAQLRVGLKAGLNKNKIHYSKEIVNDFTSWQDATGWTAGAMMEYTLPVLGLGFDASVMYTRMNNGETLRFDKVWDVITEGAKQSEATGKNFIEVPVNLKCKFALPVVEKLVTPFASTGPTFAFKLDDNSAYEAFKTKTCQVGWNLGAGVELFECIQLSGQYAFGINNILDGYVSKGLEEIGLKSQGKAYNNYWTVTAAYMF